MKHVTLKVSEEIKRLLPDTLEKDLHDNERICPVCGGLGILKADYPFAIETENKKMDWFNNQYFKWCGFCTFGVQKLCKYCGKPLFNGMPRCNCEGYLAQEREEQAKRYQLLIDRAIEVEFNNDLAYYDERSDKYFYDLGDFLEYYWNLYQESDAYYFSFNEYFELHVPKVLWVCEQEMISICVDNILEDACYDLHEDAEESISLEDKKELQNYLDNWCSEQTGTTTYYPGYVKYVKVKREWFDEMVD